MDESVPKKKRRRIKSLNDEINIFSQFWSTKKELEDYIKLKNYKYRSSEEKTERQRCRFCLAINPNSSQHMIQVYLNCVDCVKSNYNCSKTNICEIQKKFEILTKHKELSPDEWLIFDNDSIETSILQSDIIFENRKPESNSFDDELTNRFLSMNINNKIQNEYYQSGKFYVWSVQEVFPSQKYLFKEVYIIKIRNIWIEFRNGQNLHNFKHVTDNSDEIILRREDGTIYKLNSNVFFNCEEDEIVYQGEWIHNANKQNPCIECSNQINKMVFECNQHTNVVVVDFDTWEEYCNDEITDLFKFIGFDKNSDLIIQRHSKENPDYLRFTDRELFIGAVKDYIYYPLYTGCWQTEQNFEENRSQNNLKIANQQLKNKVTLSDIEVEEYLKLVRQYLKKKNIPIQGLEDPIILKYVDSEKISKHLEFARIVSLNNNNYVFCTGNFGTETDVCIFDILQPEQIDESLSKQIKKWFLKETISLTIARTKNFNLNLAGYYSLAWLTAYVMNFGLSDLSYVQNLIFDDSKIIDHYIHCIKNNEIALFPTIIGMTEFQEINQILDEEPILNNIIFSDFS
ncbi:hypothetical protein BpHYR1_046658 [Brachionus plicatilis]|uniref:Uncharacterized protein n=1 Tax=Brachionus plicatilis TaxID=10195 RepID=A0A3M7RW19_BRAPC|nr:hypothetical protein BpHYR1_046658 [Brachionus plicatilis]